MNPLPLLQHFDTIILADGIFPTHPSPTRLLQNATRIISCDGATNALLEFGLEPSFIVGDLDSISAEIKEKYKHILHQNTDQEINDLTKAIQFCVNKGWDKITILGATGKREDHTLGNISLLADYAKLCQIQMLTDYGVFTAISETTVFESRARQQISIFSLTPDTILNTENLLYPIRNRKLSSWWEGTLNEALMDRFTIEMDRGKVLVFRAY